MSHPGSRSEAPATPAAGPSLAETVPARSCVTRPPGGGVLAAAAAAVSFTAQYRMVDATRHLPVVAALEARSPTPPPWSSPVPASRWHCMAAMRSGPGAEPGRRIALAEGADILVHQVADLGYLERHGTDAAELARMAALHTDVSEVGGVAERARVSELILSHYLPAEPDAITDADWAQRAGQGFSGTTTAGRDGLRRTLPRPTS